MASDYHDQRHHNTPRILADSSGRISLEGLPSPIFSVSETNRRLEAMRLIMLGEIAWNRQHIDQAIELYSSALSLYPDAETAARTTEVALMGNSFEYALQAAQVWAHLDPTNEHAQATTLILLTKGNELAAMQPFINHLVSLPLAKLANTIGLITNQLDGKTELSTLQQALRNHRTENESDSLSYALAFIAKQLGNTELALSTLKPLLEHHKQQKPVLTLYLSLLQDAGQLDVGLALLEEQLQLTPADQELRLMLAKMLIEQRAFANALSHLEQLEETPAYQEQALLLQAVVLLEQQQSGQAKQLLQQILALNPYHNAANYYLGYTYEEAKELAAAIAYYQNVGPGPYYLSAQISVAVLTAATGDVPQALAQIHNLVLNYPQHRKELTLTSVQVLLDAEEYESAFVLLQQALAKTPKDIDLLYARSLIAAKKDDLEMAEADLRQVLSLEPNHADALNALGFTLADRTDRYQEAQQYIERAYALEPNNPSVLDSMGWVLYRLEQYEKAIEYLREAHLLSRDSEIAAHLGEVLWVSGATDAATNVWQEALANHPENQVLLDVIGRFQSEILANNPTSESQADLP